MCGIAGEISFEGPVDHRAIRGMTDALVHRGPDDEGVYCEGPIGLGHRRLSIIDLSETGHQPMWTADRSLAIVFNGEVYNHGEIRPDLEARGYGFRGSSDTEVVLNAIHCWGLDAALKRFIGMFAFATWHAGEKTLCLVRDRIGIKPMYYQKGAQRLVFGSEPKALYAHPGFAKGLSTTGLSQFFCYGYTLGEATIYENMRKLPAGHYLRVSAAGEAGLTRYWSLDDVERGSFRGSFEAAAEQLTALCQSAFEYRLVSDVPVGVFLSGGIDSTFLASFLKKRSGVDLEHITIGFNDPVYDESPKAMEVANRLGVRHTVKTLDARQAQDALFRFVEIWDEPFGDTSGIPTSILCALAREQVKVALSADGGDELFCGYESYPAYDARYRRTVRVPFALRSAAASLLRRSPYRSLISGALSLQRGTRWNPQVLARFEKAVELMEVRNPADLVRAMNEKGWTARTVGGLLGAEAVNPASGTVFSRNPQGGDTASLIDHMMRTDLAAFLGEDILTKVDRASMAVSLECRDPLLDHRLAEFAFSLPTEYLFAEGEHKRILKHILRPWMGNAIINAPKRGFVIPLYEWLRGPWKPLVLEYLAGQRVRAVGVLDERVVAQEVKQFYKYQGGRAEKIMLMLNFQMWAERWM